MAYTIVSGILIFILIVIVIDLCRQLNWQARKIDELIERPKGDIDRITNKVIEKLNKQLYEYGLLTRLKE